MLIINFSGYQANYGENGLILPEGSGWLTEFSLLVFRELISVIVVSSSSPVLLFDELKTVLYGRRKILLRIKTEMIKPLTVTTIKITRLNLENTFAIGLNGFLDGLFFIIYYFVKTSIVIGSTVTLILEP